MIVKQGDWGVKRRGRSGSRGDVTLQHRAAPPIIHRNIMFDHNFRAAAYVAEGSVAPFRRVAVACPSLSGG